MPVFDIETYLNSLSEQVTILELSYKKITYLPDLSRFKNLTHLYCNNNKLTSLIKLPNSLKYLYCSDNQLKFIPELPIGLCILNCRNNNLESLPLLPNELIELNCSDNKLNSLPNLPNKLMRLYANYNQLNSIPLLPKNIKMLYCNCNRLISLPRLPNGLLILCCEQNRLGCLPILPNGLSVLYFEKNPITETIISNIAKYNRNLKLFFRINKVTKIMNKFRYLCYCFMLRNKFRRWLWEKVREPHIKKLYHPEYLEKHLLNEDVDLDEVLTKW